MEVSVSGVMKSTTMHATFLSAAASWPPRPASATPTSISTWLGGGKWQICQRCNGWSWGNPAMQSALCAKGGAWKGARGVVGPVQLHDPGGVAQRGIARRDPDEAVALDHRKAARARKTLHPLAGHRQRPTVAPHPQAVVAASQFAVAHPAQ